MMIRVVLSALTVQTPVELARVVGVGFLDGFGLEQVQRSLVRTPAGVAAAA
jgi:hypothetical protein